MKIGLLLYGSLNHLTGGFLYDRLLKDFFEQRGDEVAILPLPWKRYGSGLLDNAFLSAARLLRGRSYDLIIEDALAQPSLLRFNIEMRRLIRCPTLSIVHSLYSNMARTPWTRACLRKLEGLYFKSVDGLVFNSQTTRIDAESAAGTSLRGVVAYPGSDRLGSGLSEEEIIHRTINARSLEILFAGSLIRHKGLHLLLSALGRLSSNGTDGKWRLTVAGNEGMDPSYVNAIRSNIKRSGWSGNVKLMGKLGPTEMANCFSTSQLLIVPSNYEGFGMVYLEGMAFGLPAIGSTRGGAKEIIRNEENGFLIQPGDDRSLSRHIDRLLNQRDLLIQLSLNAKNRHRMYPSWATTLGTIHSFCESFL